MPLIAPRAMRFLMVLSGVPPLTVIAGALLTQNGLKAAWANSMFNLAGLLAVALAGERFDTGALKRIGAVALFLLLLLPTAYGIAAAVPLSLAKPLRVQWPGPQIAERMGNIWYRATQGAPLRIVAGDSWIAGLVGLSHKDRPQLLSHADIHYSPWISAAQVEADDMLVLWQHEKSEIALKLMPYIAPRLAQTQVEAFKSRYSHKELRSATSSCRPNPPRADCELAFASRHGVAPRS